MKIFMLLTLISLSVYAGNSKDKPNLNKVKKRKDYCSPLQKMTGKCKEETNKNDKEFVDKIKKKEDYCSPLQKMTGDCKKKK